MSENQQPSVAKRNGPDDGAITATLCGFACLGITFSMTIGQAVTIIAGVAYAAILLWHALDIQRKALVAQDAETDEAQ